MDHVSRIRAHFADSAQLKLAAADALAPAIARAADLFTTCLLGDGKISPPR
jgi:phosphoheptose isomerase